MTLSAAERHGSLSVIMPLYDNAPHLHLVLPPLTDALRSGEVDEVIVVDDSSTDDGPEQCRLAGFTVISSGGRRGPAACRNLGAREASGNLLLFVDSDVVIHPDVPARIRVALEQNPEYVAVFGSYDAQPGASGIVSRYRNLLHHYHHQIGDPEANTFWAGCGAILREPFTAVGGFDDKRFPRPSIEDIELGDRLRQAGHRILLDRDILCTHQKRWTLRNMIATDVWQRAIPWSRMLLERPRGADEGSRDLNLSLRERLKAVAAIALWSACVGAAFHPVSALLAAILLLVAIVINARFYRLVLARQGVVGALAAILLHQLYYLYSTVAYLWCLVESAFGRRTVDGVAAQTASTSRDRTLGD